MNWKTICPLTDLLPGTGVCALVDNDHVAIFRPEKSEQLFATSNIDPVTGSSVMSRGLIGEKDGAFYVASPLLKQRYLLACGASMDQEGMELRTFDVRVHNNRIQIRN